MDRNPWMVSDENESMLESQLFERLHSFYWFSVLVLECRVFSLQPAITLLLPLALRAVVMLGIGVWLPYSSNRISSASFIAPNPKAVDFSVGTFARCGVAGCWIAEFRLQRGALPMTAPTLTVD